MKKIFGILLVAAVLAAGLIWFFTSKTGSQNQSKDKITIHAGTSGVSNPFSFEDKGELTGYDVALLNKVFENSDKYNLEWDRLEFPSILSGLDSGRLQIGANNFSGNEERRQRYDFTNPIVKNPNVIVVREDENVEDLSSLAGKKAVTEVGNSGATLLEEFNKNNDNQIDIIYTKEDLATQFLNIENGKYDARIVSKISAETLIRNSGYKLKIVEIETKDLDINSYFLLSKNEDQAELIDFINKRLEELRENGEWEKISQEFLKGNFLPDK